MLIIRCDSCGELQEERYYGIRAYRTGMDGEMKPALTEPFQLNGQTCFACIKDFLSGKMHSDATIDKSIV